MPTEHDGWSAPRAIAPVLLLIFFLSGAAGLIYEVVWTRWLTLVFGTTVYAYSVVLSAFMAGLALGSLGWGRWADRHRQPLKAYAALELGIAVFALLLPGLIRGLESVYLAVYHPLSDRLPSLVQGGSSLLSLFRFAVAFLVLLVPTTLMGGTLPVMTKVLARREDIIGATAGRLYFANTLGAVLGAFSSGYLLIQLLGVQATSHVAVLFNLLAAGGAFVIARRYPSLAVPSQAEAAEPAPAVPAPTVSPADRYRWIAPVYALSGFTALAYEVLWTRILSLYLGNTTYAFSIMLSTFLCGIALGSAMASRAADRLKEPALRFALLEILIGLLAACSLALVPSYDLLFEGVQLQLNLSGWSRELGKGVFFSFLLMFIPTVLFGATFPLAARIYTRRLSVLGRDLGNIYAANTFGAIFGSLGAGFVLIPLLGIQKSVIALALLNLALGLFVLFRLPAQRFLRKAFLTGAALLLLALAVSQVALDRPLVLSVSGIYREGDRMLFYEDEPDSTVVVLEGHDGVRRLYSNRNVAAEDSRWDLPSHKLIAHIPLLLHPEPRETLVIGFGMGCTSDSITRYGAHVDAVEISRGVIEANRFFTHANHHVLDGTGVTLYLNDGRNFVLSAQKKYDMICSGIIHPIVSTGSAHFYSTDFYRLCTRILSPQGVMSQWVPLHGLAPEDFLIIVRSFLEVFPHTTLWSKCTNNFILLVGTVEPVEIDFAEFCRRIAQPRIAADLAEFDMNDPYALLDTFTMDEATVAEYVGPGQVHTDDRPYVEFSRGGPATQTVYPSLQHIIAFRRKVFPRLSGLGSATEAAQVEATLDRYFAATEYALQGQLYYVLEEHEQELAAYRRALEINPDDENTRFLLSVAKKNLIQQVQVNADRMLRQGRLDEAIQKYERLLQQVPEFALGYSNLGHLYERQRRYEEAMEAYAEAIRADPSLPQAYYNMGMLWAGVLRDPEEARQWFLGALERDPGFQLAREALAQLEQVGPRRGLNPGK